MGGAPVRRASPLEHRRPGCSAAATREEWLLVVGVIVATSAVALLMFPQVRHWFILPVSTAGALVGVEAISWLRRRVDLLDPQAMLSLLGVHLFYVAPVLHVVLDHWPRFLLPVADWPTALGVMGLVNTAGLCLYRGTLAVAAGIPDQVPSHRRVDGWPAATNRLRPDVLYVCGLLAALLGILAFGMLVLILGGPGQLLTAYTLDRAALENLGWLLILAESFPLICFALTMVRWRETLRHRPWLIFLAVVGFAAVQFLVGGLRGSRSNTLWPIVLGLVLIHLLVRQISGRVFVVAALSTGLFLYSYGLYKGAGTDVLRVVDGKESIAEISAQTGRDLPTLLLGDLSRADVQALVLDRHRQGAGELGLGTSYLNAMMMPVPSAVLPHRPPDKVELGTDLTTGAGMYESGRRSSRIYGLAGEAVLNFGLMGAILSFLLLGVFTRWCRQRYLAARHHGGLAARLLAPVLSLAPPMVLLNDSGNYVWFFVKFVLPLLAVVTAAMVITRLRRPLEPERVARLADTSGWSAPLGPARDTAVDGPVSAQRPARTGT